MSFKIIIPHNRN